MIFKRLPVLLATLALISAIPADAQWTPEKPGSDNITVLGHIPLGPRLSVADMDVEQELSRPYAYVARMVYGWEGPRGTDIIDISDPKRPEIIYEWRIEDQDLHVGTGGMDVKHFKWKDRYYVVQSLQFRQGGPNPDLGAVVLDVTGLPDPSSVKEVARIREPELPGGFHNIFVYKHSDGRVLLIATVSGPFAQVYDLGAIVEGDMDNARAGRIPVPDGQDGRRGYHDDKLAVPAIELDTSRETSTQMAFGKILDDLSKGDSELAARIVTTSPDVTGTTNLGPWVNRRKLFARAEQGDAFIEHRIPSTAKWEFTPEGQHIELGIAEMNLMLLLGAAGLSHSLFGKRLIPIGTVYDPFVARGLDALNYACYQDARFILVGTPSGVTLAPEGGAHQSVGSPLIGMSQDGLASFEPAFADELAVIMEWAFDYLQRDGEGDPDERTWLRDETGGSVYLRLTTNPIEQPGKRFDQAFRQGAIDGAYWLRQPGRIVRSSSPIRGPLPPRRSRPRGSSGRAAGMLGCWP